MKPLVTSASPSAKVDFAAKLRYKPCLGCSAARSKAASRPLAPKKLSTFTFAWVDGKGKLQVEPNVTIDKLPEMGDSGEIAWATSAAVGEVHYDPGKSVLIRNT